MAPLLTRKQLLQRSGAAVLGLSAAAQLAACGGDSDELVFSSWPEYIDADARSGSHPTLDRFSKQQGVEVRYVPEINDYAEYFAKLRPQLARGQSGGRDLIVAVDWLAARMRRLGYVQRLDALELPHVRRNLVERLRSPSFDAQRRYSVPWQSGQTGLVYRRDAVGGDLTSLDEIFAPRFRGKVVLQSEMRDTVGLMMLAAGDDPERDGLDSALAAVERVERAVHDGHVRGFSGLDYRNALLSGDAEIAFGWSGDAVQLRREQPQIRFAHPAEGFMLWTDNLQIPVGAPHVDAARRLIDFYYRPDVQLRLTRYLHYVPPVDGVRELAARHEPALAEDPLVFPGDRLLARARVFRNLPPAQERHLDAAFQRALGA
ncbi:MAG TPA: spermidine/putrescine ABC transporter substrate-binding protein [Thermoleophilaceae bacterium]